MQRTKTYMPVLSYGGDLAGAAAIASDVGALATYRPWRSWLAVASDYGVILAALTAFQMHPSFALWLPLFFIVGSRQHALAVLMHEAAHGLLFQNRRLNDWVGQFLCANPLVIVSLRRYRWRHRRHHVYLNSAKDPEWDLKAKDPDWSYPIANRQMLLRMGRVLLGGGVFYLLKAQIFAKATTGASSQPLHPAPDHAVGGGHTLRGVAYRLVYLVAVSVVVSLLHAWRSALLLWLLPLVTIMPFFERIRTIAEHMGLPRRTDLNATRSMRAGRFSRFFLGPHHVNFHLEHHLYPMVPCYNLPRLAALLDSLPDFRARAHTTLAYVRVQGRRTTLWGDLTTIPAPGEGDPCL